MNRHTLLVFTFLCGSIFSSVFLISWKEKETKADASSIQASVVKSFSLLQKSGATFIKQAKCASCHHSTLTSLIVAKMKEKGVTAGDTTTLMRTISMDKTLEFACNPNINTQMVPAKFLSPYVLVGLGAEQFPADINTDIAIDYIIGQALPDGSFKAEYTRVPLEMGDIHLTAFSIRAIQLYASPAKAEQVKQKLAKTKEWLEKQKPHNQQELAFQLLGMYWCGSNEKAKKEIAKKLLLRQKEDGGWSQEPTMKSDAYATGQTLYALLESGIVNASNKTYLKGISYLLKTQDETGAWLVNTRSNPIQPFINSGFPPYDENQYISAAATNWATLALVSALPDKNQIF